MRMTTKMRTTTINQQELVLGKFYSRLCVRAASVGKNRNPRWWPVIGPMHKDEDVVNARVLHYHVDYRFLEMSIRRQFLDAYINPVYGQVIQHVAPLGLDEQPPLMLETIGEMDIPVQSYLRARRLKLKAHYPEYPFAIPPWLKELHEIYQGQSWGVNYICPHQQSPLTGLQPDCDGNITCPLHGLRFNAETGVVLPASDYLAHVGQHTHDGALKEKNDNR